MPIKNRWFVRGADGEVVDGPFIDKEDAEKEAKAYLLQWCVPAVVSLESCDIGSPEPADLEFNPHQH